MKSKIGILGSGPVAQALGAGFIKHGYKVMLGSRNPGKLNDWMSATGKGATIGSLEKTAAFGQILVLAVKGSAAQAVLKLAGAENLSGKTIIDTTNPIADAAPEHGVIKFFTNLDKSLMEDLQNTYPDVHFVKAFNIVGNPLMVDPPFRSKPTMFIAGNQAEAKQTVNNILIEFGWEVEDMGEAQAARAIEPLCILWCIPGLRENRWTHAFKLLKNPENRLA